MSAAPRKTPALHNAPPPRSFDVPLSDLDALVELIHERTAFRCLPRVASIFGRRCATVPMRVVISDLDGALPASSHAVPLRAIALSAPASLQRLETGSTPEQHEGWVVHLVDDRGRAATRWWGAPDLEPHHLETLAGCVDRWCRAILARPTPLR